MLLRHSRSPSVLVIRSGNLKIGTISKMRKTAGSCEEQKDEGKGWSKVNVERMRTRVEEIKRGSWRRRRKQRLVKSKLQTQSNRAKVK